MAESEVLDTGAASADSGSSSDSGGMTEDQAAQSFLADLEGRSAGTIQDDVFTEASGAEPKDETEPAAGKDGDGGSDPAAAPATEPTTQTTEPAPEPLPEGKPFSYGEGKSADYITVLDGEGAFIAPDALPKLAETFAALDAAITANDDLTQQLARYEAVGGMDKVAHLHAQVAQLEAVGNSLAPLLLGTTVVGDDGKSRFIPPDVQGILKLLVQNEDGTISWHPDARQNLLDRIGIAAERAKTAAERTLGESFQKHTNARSEAVTAAQRETLRTQSFRTILQNVRTAMPQLTDEDLQDAEAAFGPMLHAYERPATKAEAQALGIREGSPVLDPSKMAGWFQRRADARAAQKVTTTAHAKVTADNAARLRAANAGKNAGRSHQQVPGKATGRPGAGKAPPPAAKGKIAPDDDGSFEYIKRRAMVGQFATQD